MNKNDVLKNAIILPLAIGIALAIALFLAFGANIEGLLPVPSGTAFAYHDATNSNDDSVDRSCLKANDSIGNAHIGKLELNICYNADYSSLNGALSYEEGSTPFDEIGCTYLRATSENARQIAKAKALEIDSIYGAHKYELCNELTFNNEFEARAYAPKLSNSLVIYYQASDGAGLSSSYNALVLKEVG